MVNIIISGASGRMGKQIKAAAENYDKINCVCGVDLNEDFSDKAFPVYKSFNDVKEKADVIIDFSSPKALDDLLSFAVKNGTNAVLCATGYTESNLSAVKKASESIAVFRSANMSLGVNVLIELVKKAAKALSDFDVEIVEKHHSNKVDAPSGTAIMLADGIKEVQNDKKEIYGRHGIVGKRDKNEIGIHAIRGGTVVGEHDVYFLGNDEKITISHEALSRKVFAEGALKAALFIKDKKYGVFSMKDVINHA